MELKTCRNDKRLITMGSYEVLLRTKIEDFLFHFKWYQRYRNAEILELLKIVVAIIAENNLECFVSGGIAYDALRGKLTRLHKDIDIAFLARHRSAILSAFEKAGFCLDEKSPYYIVGQMKNGGIHVDFFVWRETAVETAEIIYDGVLTRVPSHFFSYGQKVCLNKVPITLCGNEYFKSIAPFIASEKDRSFVLQLDTPSLDCARPRMETVIRKINLKVFEYATIQEG